MSEAYRILAEDVSYTYEESPSPVLKKVSLRVKPGEFVAVLGHNGSGKSTLAKLLNGLYIPTEGKVTVCGMDTTDEDKIWDIRRSAGMIFQNPDNQIVATVVREDVAFGLENLGVPHDEMLARIDKALAAVRMTDYAEHAPHTLSGGQKQRVAIAGILAMAPLCLIADEATAMLDPSGRAEVLGTVRRLNREEGISVIWITHFMEEAVQADRVVVMDGGKVLTQGTPEEVFSQVELLKKHRLDVPQSAELAYRLRGCGLKIQDIPLTQDDCVALLEEALR